MQISIGCFYFIKDNFFDIVNDPELMKNKENGIKRPCYYCFKSNTRSYQNKKSKLLFKDGNRKLL